jgi:S1-C subfamily serine protease
MAQKAGEVQKWRKSVGLVVSDSSGVVNFGTAFIVDDRGHAVTNYHVIKGAEAVTF